MKESITLYKEEWIKLRDAIEDALQESGKFQSQLDTYKIALKYFTDQSQANVDIVNNILKGWE